ncbi:hypothetical protein NP493_277g02016 [Ridgeia piscesae]|uniref:Mediator of RNA polymerase II transcription subunit 6 n=1 Tax=Ridgeia piscesae TaxID=27915 RepID=A0AAD9NXA1_RIDPI|nr:hypothetical protein NP493_277g02016 [Ridgeia piscesae]
MNSDTGMGTETQLAISWYDSAWIPVLNQGNILDYFAERSNPFYDRTCNNEIVRMQRLSSDQLNNMVGLEYVLLHVQEPILYVIRKQHRHSPTQATPLADYNIIAGVVYQAPDLGSVINSRLVSASDSVDWKQRTREFPVEPVGHLSPSESFVTYSGSSVTLSKSSVTLCELSVVTHSGSAVTHSGSSVTHGGSSVTHSGSSVTHSGSSVTHSGSSVTNDKLLSKEKKKKEEPSSLFQRQRVDELLAELSKKFPPRYPTTTAQTTQSEKPATGDGVKLEAKTETKTDSDMQPPPEKKVKVMCS